MNWEQTKSLASSNFAKYTILIPIIGWLLVYNGEFQSFISEAFGVSQQKQEGIDWRIMVFYLGLVFMGASSALFQLRCPTEIKSHDGLGGFIDDTVAHLTDQRFTALCKAYGVEKPTAKGPADGGFSQNDYLMREQWVKFQAEDIYDTLTKRYEVQLTVRNCARYGTVFLFSAGVLITLVPTFSTLWWVLTEITSQITS